MVRERRRKRDSYSGASSFRLFWLFSRERATGNTRKRNEKEEQKRIGTNERMGFLRLSAFPLKGLYI